MKLNFTENLKLKFYCTFIVVFILAGCSYETETARVSVKYAGAIKNFIQDGDLSAQASLDTLDPVDLYGLGVLENLEGEIIILDGRPYLSRKIDGKIVLEESYDAKASLLVYARVPEWSNHEVKVSINSMIELESLVEETAIRSGVNIEKPFPFMVRGKMANFQWHVIDWPEGNTELTYQKHLDAVAKKMEKDREVTLLGFYSRHHKGVFTPFTSEVHIHVLSDDYELAGHLDAVAPGKNFTILLPS